MTAAADTDIQHRSQQIESLKQQFSEARRRPAASVQDVPLRNPDGTATTLSVLVGDRADLIVIVSPMRRTCRRTLPQVAAGHSEWPRQPAAISQKRLDANMMEGLCREFRRFAANRMAPIVRTGNDVFGPGDDYSPP